MTTKRIPNTKLLMQLAQSSPNGFTTKDARTQIKGLRASTLHSMLWKLKRDNVLKRDDAGKYTLVNAPAPTPAANVSTRVYKKKERPQSSGDAVYEREIRDLTFRVRQLNEHTAQLKTQLDDALSIIRYLEDKLFKAIQFDARNGSNS
jgi:predicted RNase H-like nuclease (RuvC/YqgF family)